MIITNIAFAIEGYDHFTYIEHTDTDIKLAWDVHTNSIEEDYYEVRAYNVGKKAYEKLGSTNDNIYKIKFSKVGLYILEVRSCRKSGDDIKYSEWTKSTVQETTKNWWINIFRKPPGTLMIN